MNIIKGFSSVQELMVELVKFEFEYIENYKVIKFCNMFYCVGIQSLEKAVVITAKSIWYLTDGYWVNTNIENSKLIPYSKCNMLRNNFKKYDEALCSELLNIDKGLVLFNIRIKNGKVKLKKYTGYMNSYFVILSTIFHDKLEFTLYDLDSLSSYKIDIVALKTVFNDFENILSVNPFIGYVLQNTRGFIESRYITPKYENFGYKRRRSGYRLSSARKLN